MTALRIFERTARRTGVGRRLPLGAGAAMQPFAEMRSLSIVCFARTLGTAARGQMQSIKRGSYAPRVQRDRLDLDAHDLSLPWFLEHRVQRVRLGPAVCRRADSVCSGFPRVDGSFGHVRIDPPSLTRVDRTMNRMRFANVSKVLWQGHDRWACQVDGRTGHGAILARASSSVRAATAEHA
jgi:hypothetical protein